MKGYADYMMVLSPPESISSQVKQHKAGAAGIIGAYDSLHSLAHISIKQLPRRKPYMADPEIKALDKSLRLLPPVTLMIDGFDYFAHGDEYRTIYARIQATHFTNLWFKALKKHLNIKDYLVPHITIARNIHVTAYNKLWPHFRNMRWVEEFDIKELIVLQREAFANYAAWETFTVMPFEGRHLLNDIPSKQSLLKSIKENPPKNQQISLF